MVIQSRGNVKLVMLFGIVGLILTIGAVVATLYFTGFLGHSSGRHQDLPPIYLDLKPAFVVNAADKNQDRFMQVAVTVMARNQAAIDAVSANLYAVQNDVREVISGQNYEDMINSVGIERLRKEAEKAVKKCIAAKHLPTIDALYFTSFVIQ